MVISSRDDLAALHDDILPGALIVLASDNINKNKVVKLKPHYYTEMATRLKFKTRVKSLLLGKKNAKL